MSKFLLEGPLSRRNCLIGLGSVAATTVLAGCGGNGNSSGSGSTSTGTILNVAAAAEALACTTYSNLIKGPIYAGLAGNPPDRAYLVAALEQEISHYNILVSVNAAPIAFGTKFFYPVNMFTNKQVTMNTLEYLEDVFIAAYLIAVRDFSATSDKLVAAQILGVEAEHRALGRVVANDLGLTSTTGLSGVAEALNAPSHTSNNLAYERTFNNLFGSINDVLTLLGPFINGGGGFGPTGYTFDATTLTVPAGVTTVLLDNKAP